jgi:hypothetical protein
MTFMQTTLQSHWENITSSSRDRRLGVVGSIEHVAGTVGPLGDDGWQYGHFHSTLASTLCRWDLIANFIQYWVIPDLILNWPWLPTFRVGFFSSWKWFLRAFSQIYTHINVCFYSIANTYYRIFSRTSLIESVNECSNKNFFPKHKIHKNYKKLCNVKFGKNGVS